MQIVSQHKGITVIVVLDSNIFVRDFKLNSSTFKALFSGLSRTEYSLSIPKMVLDETINKYGEKFEKQSHHFRRLGLQHIQFITGEEITRREDAERVYRNYIERTLSDVNATIVSIPDIDHSQLIERALKRKKPFRGTDTGGYRDTLVWMTVVQLALENDSVALVTNNSKDFCDQSDKEKLHKDLLQDITNLGEDAGEVIFYLNLNSFVAEHIAPALERLDSFKIEIENDEFPGFTLPDILINYFSYDLDGAELELLDSNLPLSFENPAISAIEDVFDIRDVDVRQLSPDEIYITFTADVECSFTFFIDKLESVWYGELKIEIWDSDWNKYYMLANAIAPAEISISFTYNTNSGEITSARFTSFHVDESILGY
ncbi:DUF4935 domain-containing protein [Candidatus Uhrbacteria bacterium]|nr:DUF4935 domain-containing protein [Candidatus Uhrbacteria bacterium]